MIFALVLLHSNTGGSQPLQISGYTRASVYGGGKKYDFASLFAEAALNGNFRNGNALLSADIRLRSGIGFSERYTVAEIKEAYGGYHSEKFSVLMGNQIVNWNRSDLFSPFAALAPSEPFFLSGNPDDQRMSSFMLNLSSRISERVSCRMVLIPVYRESQYRFDLYNLGEGVGFTGFETPEKKLKNGSIGFKLDITLPGTDLSFKLFRGFDPDYGFKMLSFTPDISGSFNIVNQAVPYLRRTAGADIAVSAGRFILKGESVVNFTENYEKEIHIPYPSIELVAGAETSLHNFVISAEYSCKRTIGFRKLPVPLLTNPADPSSMLLYAEEMARYEFAQLNRKIFRQQKQYNHSLALNLSGSLADEVLKINLSAIGYLTSSEFLLNGNLEWKVTDNLSLSAGFNYLSGPQKSPFYYSKDVINGVFTQIKVSL